MNAEEQLEDELAAQIMRLEIVFGPDTLNHLLANVPARAAGLAAGLGSDDPKEAAQTAVDLMSGLWPHGTPERVGQADWWQSPLGIAVARASGVPIEPVTQAVAGEMLGVSRGDVAQTLHRGLLSRAAGSSRLDGAAVLDRIVKLADARAKRAS